MYLSQSGTAICENAFACLFSNPYSEFGSLVNDRVTDSSWETGDKLGGTWKSRNAFSYARNEKGAARPKILNTLLKSTRRIV